MNDYYQPDFYHFSEDSILLANFVISEIENHKIQNILDIGAGCGVIGMELANNLNQKVELVCLEPQEVFHESIRKNKANLSDIVSVEIIQESIGNYDTKAHFDLVVSNPPYFQKGTGRVSPNMNRQICRTFEIDSLETFLQRIRELKSEQGIAFLVFPNTVYVESRLIRSFGFKEVLKQGAISIYRLSSNKNLPELF